MELTFLREDRCQGGNIPSTRILSKYEKLAAGASQFNQCGRLSQPWEEQEAAACRLGEAAERASCGFGHRREDLSWKSEEDG